ncbi:MAG: hypothetical protein IT190_10350, partial [Microbacteriaceae bacterium]|nr:hypothetical protein [Microbacteriaceae bacterium]
MVLSGTGVVESNKFKGAASVSDAVDLATSEVNGVLPIANGGTATSTVPTNGQMLIGNGTGYTVSTLTAGNNIAIDNNAGSITIRTTVASIDSGSADNQTLRWDNTAMRWVKNNNVLATSAGNVSASAGVNLNGANSPLQSNGSGGTSGQVLSSTGNTTTPSWTSTLPGLTITNLTSDYITLNHTITGDSAVFNTINVGTLRAAVPFDSIKTGTNVGQTLTVGNGSSLVLSGSGIIEANKVKGSGSTTDAVDLATSEVNGVLPIANGGTNSSTALNNNRIMVSSGGSIVEAGALTNGQLLIGSTGAAPVAATLTGGTGISISNNAGSITINSTASQISNGTTTNSTLRWNGTNWVENTSLLATATGSVTVGGNSQAGTMLLSDGSVSAKTATIGVATLGANRIYT